MTRTANDELEQFLAWESHEDDSTFVAAADFFSLIALMAIMSVMLYGSSISGSAAVEPSREPSPGRGSVAFSDVLFLFVTAHENAPHVEFRYNTEPLRVVPIEISQGGPREKSIAEVIFVLQQILDGKSPASFVCLIERTGLDQLDGFYIDLLGEITDSGYDCGVGIVD